MKFIIYRYFQLLQRFLIEFYNYDLNRKKGIELKEETKISLSKVQFKKKPILQKLLLETLVIICTEYISTR